MAKKLALNRENLNSWLPVLQPQMNKTGTNKYTNKCFDNRIDPPFYFSYCWEEIVRNEITSKNKKKYNKCQIKYLQNSKTSVTGEIANRCHGFG